MLTKGSDVNNGVSRLRGRSPSLPQNKRLGMSPTPPSILEIKKLLTSTEARSAPIYNKPTVCSLIYAQSLKKPCSVDKINPPRRSLDKSIPKIMSTKTSNEIGVAPKSPRRSLDKSVHKITSTKTYNEIGVAPKAKDLGKPRLPLRPNNSLNVIEKNVNCQNQTKQLKTSLVCKSIHVENTTSMCDAILSTEDHHNNITNHEQDDKDILLDEIDKCNVTLENVNKEHINDHDSDINQDQENQELEIEHVPPEIDIGSKVVEHEENKPKEHEIERDSKEEPKNEDLKTKVVAQGKKDIAACKNVKEEAVNEKLRDRVKQLVGVFESVISHDSSAIQR